MKILITKKTLHFAQAFKIAYEEVEQAEMVFLQLVDDNGLIGLGSASPDTEVTGETVESVYQIMKNSLNDNFFNLPINQWYAYHEKITEAFKNFPSAAAAVEQAIINLWAQTKGYSLPEIWGGYRTTCPIMFTLGIKNIVESVRDVQQRSAEGFKIIKIKCGLDPVADLARIKAIKNILQPDQQIILDANQGYTFNQAKKIMSELRNLDIALIEQPIAAQDWQKLKKLHSLHYMPVVADEAVVTVEDASKLLFNDYVSGVNIKLMKCGGPINFIRIFHLAKSLKKIIMLGCMYESNISITMGANLALALPIDYVDLDSGHFDFPDDPASGGAVIKNGNILIKESLILHL